MPRMSRLRYVVFFFVAWSGRAHAGYKANCARAVQRWAFVAWVEIPPSKAKEWCAASSKDLSKTYKRSLYTPQFGLHSPTDSAFHAELNRRIRMAYNGQRYQNMRNDEKPPQLDAAADTVRMLPDLAWLSESEITAIEQDGPYGKFLDYLVSSNPHNAECIKEEAGLTNVEVPDTCDLPRYSTVGIDPEFILPEYRIVSPSHVLDAPDSAPWERVLSAQLKVKVRSCLAKDERHPILGRITSVSPPARVFGLHRESAPGKKIRTACQHIRRANCLATDYHHRVLRAIDLDAECKKGIGAQRPNVAKKARHHCEELAELWADESALLQKLGITTGEVAGATTQGAAQVQEMAEKVDALQKWIDDLSKPLDEVMEKAAAMLHAEITKSARSGDFASAKAKLDQLKKEYFRTKAYSRAKKLERELEVIGKIAPAALHVEKWFFGKTKIDLQSSRPTVLIFWEVWCPYCRHRVPKFQTIYDQYSRRGLQMVGLTRVTRSATDEKVDAFIKEHKIDYPIAKENGDLSREFNVSAIPAAAVVKDGKIVWRGHPGRLTDKMIEGWL